MSRSATHRLKVYYAITLVRYILHFFMQTHNTWQTREKILLIKICKLRQTNLSVIHKYSFCCLFRNVIITVTDILNFININFRTTYFITKKNLVLLSNFSVFMFSTRLRNQKRFPTFQNKWFQMQLNIYNNILHSIIIYSIV